MSVLSLLLDVIRLSGIQLRPVVHLLHHAEQTGHSARYVFTFIRTCYRFFLIILIISFYVAAFYGPVINDPHCGRSATRISRIVGGADASFGQFPWQAFVQVGGSRCGGALVGQKHVVTAGQ